jgi:Xaa-Pro aminopeptidase
MFDKADAYLIFDANNRFYFSRRYISSGCIVLAFARKFYVTDGRYETELKENAPDFETVIVKKGETYPAVARILSDLSARTVAFEDDLITYRDYCEIAAALTGFTLVNGADEINGLRAVKSDAELADMSAAQKITARAYSKTLEKLRTGVTERELAAELLFDMLSDGADDYAVRPILAFGANAAAPHHTPDDTKLKKGDCVLFDVGARYRGYCSDMTRTVFFKEAETRLAELYALVSEAQDRILDNLAEGMTGHEADSFAREFFTARGVLKLFGHGSGHGVGVFIHEQPSLSLGSADVLRSGMVVTVEPGLYLPGVGGVRIEDMVEITDTGARNMTDVKKDLLIIK